MNSLKSKQALLLEALLTQRERTPMAMMGKPRLKSKQVVELRVTRKKKGNITSYPTFKRAMMSAPKLLNSLEVPLNQ